MRQLNPEHADPFPNTIPNPKNHNGAGSYRLPVRAFRFAGLIFLLLAGFCMMSNQAKARSNWTDNNDYWNVWYDATDGAIHVKVLVYDRKYGPADEDGYIDYAHLQYSSDGANYTDFYYIDYDSGPSKQDVSSRNGLSTSSSSSDDGRYITYEIKLYIKNSINNITKIRIVGNWDVNGAYGSDDVDASRSVTVPKMGSITTPTYTFILDANNAAKARISYTKFTIDDLDNRSTIKLYNGNGVAISGDLSVSTSGYYDAPVSSSENTYYFLQSAYGGNMTTTSSSVMVPAFTFPKSASASYNSTAHTVTFNWTMDPVSSTNVVKDKFKLQLADNANFTNAQDISFDYDATKSSYSYTVDKNLMKHMYFRVARNHNGFDWELAKTTDIVIPFDAIDESKVKLTLQSDNTALLQWDPLSTAWVPGASFVITRINNTSKTETAIKLSEDDYNKGSYIDKQIAICNEYTYTLQIIPPDNAGFTAFAPVQVASTVLPTEIGTIFGLTASKGYFPDRTELKWGTKGAFDNFIIKRAMYGSDHYVQLAAVTGLSSSDYQTDDTKGTPGVYYQYMVIGVVNCNNKAVYSKDTLYAIGFRSPTGNIYGRVTYDNGQAVENVAVRLESSDGIQLGQSVYLNGNSGSYLKLDSLNTPFTDSALTVEAWIRPDDTAPKNQVIFSRGGQYELGFDAAGKLYFSYNGQTVTGPYINPNQSFVHVAGMHSNDSLGIMVNDSMVARIAAPFQAAGSVDKIVYIGRNTAGNNFKGYIDEMRVWNIALSPSLIARDYTRMLAGDDRGLAAYWRFDETIKDQFYDASHRNDQYNQNDGVMNAAYVVHSDIIPSSDQLSLKAYTDNSGNYMISGIPFTGNGTTYTIVPLLGTHQFDPLSVNRLISESSTSFTVDFKDRSSFPVSGFVYYNNSTVPVTGVQFKIDGQYAQQNNGDIIETDASGKFTISVPVGTHQVQAVKNNHVFINSGRITDRFGKDLNYQEPVSQRVLYDSTTIRFIGRVAGGPVEEAYPLGHSLSSNNLGKELSLTMTLPTGTKYELYAGPESDSTIIVRHRLLTQPAGADSSHHSRVVYYPNKIVIYPDSLTGEFEADLIPEKFNVDNVNATGWGDLLDGKPVSLDFSDKFPIQYSINNYQDSVQSGQDSWTYTDHSDTVAYNDSYKFIKRVTPSVSISQLDNIGKELPYFGNAVYESLSFAGQEDSIQVIDTTKTGKAIYVFGNPLFKQNELYHFKIKAFEEYPFYESVKQDGTLVIAQKNGKDQVADVPTEDGHVSLYNKIRNGPADPDTLSLDENGVAYYDFTAGDPDLAAQGLKDFAATVQFGQATNVNWSWFGNQQMEVYVAGGKMTGTDFVTAGPDKLLLILRDPPGSRSYSYAENGSVISTTSTYSGSVDQEGDEDLTTKLGTELVTFTGIGVGTINSAVATTGIGFGVHHEEHYVHTNTKESTTTLTTRFQTGDDPTFVGAPADLFVGYSTNITYGQSNNITIIRRSELKATDTKIFEPSPSSQYLLVQRSGINIGESFGTLFAYPQQHIETVLIPNLINIRNTILQPPGTSAQDAQANADARKEAVYVSKLPAGDPNFGKSNNDTIAFGSSAKSDPFYDGKSYKIYFPTTSPYRTDTIMTINQYVDNWKQRMADNEKAKLNATLLQNYSFHAGSPVEYSMETSTSETNTNSFNIIISGSVTNSTDVKILGNGFEFKFNESLGTDQGGDFGSTTDSTSTMGFVLASDGTDDYFSVDVDTVNSGFAFRTKGGVSACPYEGTTLTKYYQPGTVLDQPTQRIEVPKLAVDKPVATNVPSSRKASYNLILRNESEAKLPATFVLSYTDNDSIKGATIAVDGVSIGGSGRAVVVQYGESVTKVLTLEKGPDAMDYNNIQILLHSSCQYDPTGYQENIADTVLISAHFIPSCSDIHIKSPADQWVLNTESPTDPNNKRYLPVTIDQFDVTNKLFDHIELQYKASSDSKWTTVTKFYADSAKFNAAQGGKLFITNAQGINYNLVMDDASFNDQRYDIRAVSFCELSLGSYVTTESNTVSGIKDTYSPRLFGSPQPANGILGVGDDIRLNFNETIAAGLLSYPDFQVTGIRNGSQGDHSVAVRLDGQGDYLATEFDKNLTGKNITAEMWILPDKPANGTLFSQGNINTSMELALTDDNHLEITMGGKVIASDHPVDYRQGEWAHVALVYNAAASTVSAFYNFTEVIHNVAVDNYDGVGHFEFGRSISKQGNFFAGKMHEARIWTEVLPATRLQVNSLVRLSGAENNLLAYYPMTEGKGNVVYDKAHGSNAMLTGNWSTPPGKAIAFNGNGYVKMSTATAPVTQDMDYTLELWFKADTAQTDATLASNGKGDGSDAGGSLNLFSLGFENSVLTYRNNGVKIQADGNYLDNKWHHAAIAVNRNSGTAQLFVDGELKQFTDARNLGGIAAAETYLGVSAWHDADSATVTRFDRYFKGEIDEFRIWNTYLNQTLISSNNNVKLNGDELGLMLYYPFEKYYEFQNNKEMGFTLSDMKIQDDPNLIIPDAVAVNATESDDMAPVKDRGPVENLQFDYVVNNDALIINMLEPKQAIDKTIITLQAKNVRDLNGNAIASPITWTAYIDQNQLKWSDDELNLSKDVYAPLQFESYVVNNGGNIQHFRLDNLPAWLKADPSSGTVDPEGRQKITFTVNEGLNIGSYDEIIYMRNDNDEAEALSVNMKVKGKQPEWKVNPGDFKYNMSIYGKIRINNIFSTDSEDLLAAFIDGKCVGVTNNTYYADNDLWYAFLTVYSDTVQYNKLEFRIWDAGTGKVYQGIPSTAVNFSNDAIAGTPRNPVIFDGKEMLFQDINLNQGWNWISLNVTNPSIDNVKATLANGTWQSGDIIKNEELGFDQYSSSAGWVGYLQGLNNTSLFMLNTANAQTLSIGGTQVDVKQTAIPLKGGRWNYISYLPAVNMTVKEALAGYSASDEDVIKSQSGFAMYDSQNGWIGNLTYMEPGKGYMLFRNGAADTSFHYPSISGILTDPDVHRLGRTDIQANANTLEIPVSSNFAYAENMTVAAVTGSEFSLQPGDHILAYAGGELRGKAQPVHNAVINGGTLFFNIAGDREQPVSFRIERRGEVVAQSSTVLTYRPNSTIGTLSEPLVLHLNQVNSSVTIYPNPFSRQVTIQADITKGKISGTHEVQVSLYDMSGQLILKRPVELMINGHYQWIWNGKKAGGAGCPPGVYFVNITIDGIPRVYKVVKD